jgi:ABC-type multidrug transport system ATPase subunit
MVEQEAEKIAEFSDRVIVMEDGKIAMEGTPSEIFCQVERMHETGLGVTQVSELAHRLSDTTCIYDFTLFDEAFAALTSPAMLETFRKEAHE